MPIDWERLEAEIADAAAAEAVAERVLRTVRRRRRRVRALLAGGTMALAATAAGPVLLTDPGPPAESAASAPSPDRAARGRADPAPMRGPRAHPAAGADYADALTGAAELRRVCAQLGRPAVVTSCRVTLRRTAAQVAVTLACGPRCRHGVTIELRRSDGQWAVVGTGPR